MMDILENVFVLNLDSRPDRLEAADCQLKEAGIPYTRFPAISHENGIKGLLLTMEALFEKCIAEGLDKVCVLEDDFKFLLPPVPFLNEVMPQLPENYHCFHLGLNLLEQPVKVSTNILRVRTSYATHAIVYSQEAMRLILPLLKREETQPYDILLMHHIQPMGKCYCTYPMLCTQRPDHSNIENKYMDWATLMNTTYTMHTKFINMATEIIQCYNGHMIENQVPKVDHSRFEIQNPEFIGRVCDCKKFRYSERECGCTIKEWRIYWDENMEA